MKSCPNCGSLVGYDMNFCQKCGTRVAINSNKEEVLSKIELLRQYNLVYDRKSVTWKYITDDPERAMELIEESQKLVQSFCDLCKEILKENNSTAQDIIEQEIYLTVLKQGYILCKTTEIFLLNYSGYQEAFKNFQKLVEKNCITSMEAAQTISNMDSLYTSFSLINLLYSSYIKQTLDENIIYNNEKYRKHLIKFAQAFNNAILAFAERSVKLFFVPGEDSINQDWKLYTNILKGLHISDIDKLDETGWLKLLKNYSSYEGDESYETNFLAKRNDERNIAREKVKQIVDPQYWTKHSKEKTNRY